jgi:hypothetical protein
MMHTYEENEDSIILATPYFYVEVEKGLGGFAGEVEKRIRKKDFKWLMEKFKGKLVIFQKDSVFFDEKEIIKDLDDELNIVGLKIPLEMRFYKYGYDQWFEVNGTRFEVERDKIHAVLSIGNENVKIKVWRGPLSGTAREFARELFTTGHLSWLEKQLKNDANIYEMEIGPLEEIIVRTTSMFLTRTSYSIEKGFTGIVLTREGVALVKVPFKDLERVWVFSSWPKIDEKYVVKWIVRWPEIKNWYNYTVEYVINTDEEFIIYNGDDRMQIKITRGELVLKLNGKRKRGKFHLAEKYLRELGAVF